jgi:hypothetical protein
MLFMQSEKCSLRLCSLLLRIHDRFLGGGHYEAKSPIIYKSLVDI